jgi:hypothetical protein
MSEAMLQCGVRLQQGQSTKINRPPFLFLPTLISTRKQLELHGVTTVFNDLLFRIPRVVLEIGVEEGTS